MRFGRASSKKDQKEVAAVPSSSSGGLLRVMTGVDVPVKSSGKNVAAATQHRQQSSQKKSTLNSRALTADDDLLIEAFDNNIDESENDGATPAFSRSSPTLPSPAPGVHKRPQEKQQPSHQLLSDQIAAQGIALHNLNQAYFKLQQQMVKWQEQAVLSGRAALQAKKIDPTGKIILTNECKLQLLRRKLLKVNLATGEQQLIRLEVSHQALEKDLEKNKQLFSQQQSQPENLKTPPNREASAESNDILLPLQQELEHVDVVKEILSRDLAKDLIPDDDTVSEMEYDEAELLQELQTLSSMDQEDDHTTRTSLPGKTQNKSSMKKANRPRLPEVVNHRQQGTVHASSSKAKKPPPKSSSTKSVSSYKATLF